MTIEVADRQVRLRAIDPEVSFIVQAPAGSGKTALLVQRILALLAGVEQPEEILAITFTRKAASEMRERIISALRNADSDHPVANDYQQLTLELAREVLKRDNDKHWDLLKNPARLRVQTIDSLCASLVRQMPLLSNFGALPQIAEDPMVLYQQAAQRTILELESESDWSSSIEHLVAHLDNRLEYLQTLICNMLAKRDQWLRHIADPSHPGLYRNSLEAAFTDLMGTLFADLEEIWPTEISAGLLVLLQFSLNNRITDSAEDTDQVTIESFPEFTVTDKRYWQAVADLLLTSNGLLRKTVNVRQGFPARKAAHNTREADLYEHMKQEMLSVLEKLSTIPTLDNKLKNIRDLPNPHYSDDEWQTMQALFELLRLSAAQLELVFKDHGQVDYTAISRAAVLALGTPEHPTDLALTLDYKINHLLVDEFQDTSQSQYELLKGLTHNWGMGDGKTLFLVGDPMQSIYRFREAEVGLFLEAWNNGLGDIPLQPLKLHVNFRSQGGLIDWFNQSFRKIMPQHDNMETGAIHYTHSSAFHEALTEPACRVYPIVDKNDIDEARKIIEIIHDTQQQDPDSSIAILVRGRNHLPVILQQLKLASIRYKAVEIEGLVNCPVIMDLLALYKALHRPADRVAWLGLLRAPWCGLNLQDLYQLCQGNNETSILEQLYNQDVMNQLSDDSQYRLSHIRSVCGKALDNSYRLSLRDWVEGVWLELGGPGCLTKQTDLEDAEVFFQLLEKLNQVPLQEQFNELSRALGKLYSLPDTDADEKLQVMTIHKAKGLEFDTVILPGLGRRPANNDSDLMKWLERPNLSHGSDLLLAPIKQSGDQINGKYRLLNEYEKQKDWYESSRLLYVAATRARSRLHLLGHVSQISGRQTEFKPATGSLLSHLWPVVEATYTQVLNNPADTVDPIVDSVPVESESAQFFTRLSQTWQTPVPPETCRFTPGEVNTIHDVIEFDWAGINARLIGTVVHEILCELSGRATLPNSESDWKQFCRNRFLHLGMNENDLADAIETTILAIHNCQSDPRGQWILDPAHEQARSEYALTIKSGHDFRRVVIDRTFVDQDGFRWIIDYKTGFHAGADLDEYLEREVMRYRAQLEFYARTIISLDPAPIKLGLYFPLMQAWRMWDYQYDE